MVSGLPVVLHHDLATSRRFTTILSGNESAAYGAVVTQLLYTSIEGRSNRFNLRATLADAKSHQTLKVFEASADSRSQIIAAADRLARQIDGSAVPYSTQKIDALQAFAKATQAANQTERQSSLQSAVKLDPAFGAAWLALAGGGDKTFLSSANSVSASFSPIDHARFALLDQRLSVGPLSQRVPLAQAVLNLSPFDVSALLTLADAQDRQGHGAEAIEAFAKAQQLAPDNAELAGRFALTLVRFGEAARAIAQTKQLVADNPGKPVPLQLLASVQFAAGQFADAQRSFQQVGDDPRSLLSQAICKLMLADKSGADQLFMQYIGIREKNRDPLIPLARATWMQAVGSQSESLQILETGLASAPDLQAIAAAQISIWSFERGDRQSASTSAQKALSMARVPAAVEFARLAELLSKSAETNSAPQTNAAAGFAHFFNKRFEQSAKVWEAELDRSAGNDETARTMLALSLRGAGKPQQALALHPLPFIVNLAGNDPFAIFAWHAMLRLEPKFARLISLYNLPAS